MREKSCLQFFQTLCSRITPACAGKIFSNLYISFLIQDHPRVCGKNAASAILLLCISGSPPRVREKFTQNRKGNGKRRITPACAGKILRNAMSALRLLGSPPRVREKLHSNTRSKNADRITPACAGKMLYYVKN